MIFEGFLCDFLGFLMILKDIQEFKGIERFLQDLKEF